MERLLFVTAGSSSLHPEIALWRPTRSLQCLDLSRRAGHPAASCSPVSSPRMILVDGPRAVGIPGRDRRLRLGRGRRPRDRRSWSVRHLRMDPPGISPRARRCRSVSPVEAIPAEASSVGMGGRPLADTWTCGLNQILRRAGGFVRCTFVWRAAPAKFLPTGCPNRPNGPKLEPTRPHESRGKRAGVCTSPRSVGVD